MAISTRNWSPFQQMERMQQDLDRMFSSFTAESGRKAGWLPAVDVEQTNDAMILKLDLFRGRPRQDRDRDP